MLGSMVIIGEKPDIRTKSELMLWGLVQEVSTAADVKYAISYIARAAGFEADEDELYRMAVEYVNPKKTEVYGMSASTLGGDMACINVIFKDKDGKYFDLCSKDGVLCYVINLSQPHFSQLGYSWFEAKDGYYHRIA